MSTALDLFAGVGWHLGAKALGIEEEGVEIMPEAVATRDAIGAKTVHDDVWTYDYQLGAHEGHIDSPPCQTFSQSGKGEGRKALEDVLRLVRSGAYRDIEQLRAAAALLGEDERTALVLMPLHAALIERPEWLAWEQVPTVQPVWDACAEVLEDNGYHVWTGRLHSEQYGVPQARTRSVLIGSMAREVGMPRPTHSLYHRRTPERLDPGTKEWMTMAEGIGWGLTQRPSPTITGGGTETGGAEPIAKWEARYASLPEWAFRRPSTTIVGSFKPEIVAAPGYRTTVSRQNAEGSVRVSVAEAGLLQSFPADTPWQGAKGKQYLQVGNAVPPGLAIAVLGEAAGLDWGSVNAAYRAEVYG